MTRSRAARGESLVLHVRQAGTAEPVQFGVSTCFLAELGLRRTCSGARACVDRGCGAFDAGWAGASGTFGAKRLRLDDGSIAGCTRCNWILTVLTARYMSLSMFCRQRREETGVKKGTKD
jgi:hypothetical protein